MSRHKMASSESEGSRGAGEGPPAPGAGAAKLPVRYCAVYHCLHNYKTHPHLSFFGFPHDKERVELWAEKIRRPDIVQKDGLVSSYYRVCEAHFEPRHINSNRRRRRLTKRAVPTLRLPHAGPYVSVVEAQGPALPEPLRVCGRTLVRSTLEVFQYVDQTAKRKTKKQREHRCKPLIPVAAPPELAQFFSDCDRHLAPGMAELVKVVARLRQASDSRFNDLCLKLLHSNPPAYRLLQSTLDLPDVRTLHRHCVHLLPDFDTKLTELLKTRVDRMTDKEKHCTLSVEFIDVRPHLYYNITFDRIVGLHEIDGAQSPWPAARAAVVAARGLLAGWAQPVALCFLARDDEAFDRWIEKIIRLLLTIGLVVHGLVCDPMAPAPLRREVSPDRPFFQVGDNKVYVVYDPPRLMKMLLCNFQAYDFCFEKMRASWSDVLEYRKIEKHKPLTLTPGLMDAHVQPGGARRMRPERAARVLARTLAAAMASHVDRGLLPATARAAVVLMLKINNLYDMLSSTTMRTSSEYKRGLTQDPSRIGFLRYMKSFFKSLTFEKKLGTDEAEAKRLTDCWQTTIGAVLALREELEPVQRFLPTRRLHMDDEVSATARRGRNDKPTCQQIFVAFKKHFFDDMLKTPGEEKAVDVGSLLAKVVNENEGGNGSLDVELGERVRASEYRRVRLPRRGRGAAAAAARHVLLAALRVHGDCARARAYAAAPPTENFLELVSRLDAALAGALRAGGEARALLQDLLLDVHVLDCELPCECFPLEYLKLLFLRLRLYRLLRHNQARFRNATPTEPVHFEINTLE